VADFASEWLATRDGRVKPRTYEADQRNVAPLTRHFGTTRLQDLTARRIEALLTACRKGTVTDKKLSEWTCVQVYGTLRKVCDSAVANDLLVINPCLKVAKHVRPRQVAKSKPSIFSTEELEALVAAAESRTPTYAPLVAFLAFTGARAREALALRWRDLDTPAKLITFSHQIDKAGIGLVELKTESAQRVNAITPILDRFLGKTARMKAKWSGDGDFVFSPRKGKPVEYRNLRRALSVAASRPDSAISRRTTCGIPSRLICCATSISRPLAATSAIRTSRSRRRSTRTRSAPPPSRQRESPRRCAWLDSGSRSTPRAGTTEARPDLGKNLRRAELVAFCRNKRPCFQGRF
jgi:integrase